MWIERRRKRSQSAAAAGTRRTQTSPKNRRADVEMERKSTVVTESAQKNTTALNRTAMQKTVTRTRVETGNETKTKDESGTETEREIETGKRTKREIEKRQESEILTETERETRKNEEIETEKKKENDTKMGMRGREVERAETARSDYQRNSKNHPLKSPLKQPNLRSQKQLRTSLRVQREYLGLHLPRGSGEDPKWEIKKNLTVKEQMEMFIYPRDLFLKKMEKLEDRQRHLTWLPVDK